MPKVSVIIPAYQAAKTIERAIHSVQKQTYSDWEIIVVDDGSTDSIGVVVRNLASSDSRIHYLYQQNQGPATARNAGVANAKGEYIAFLDADDEWLPHKLEGQVRILDSHPSVGLIMCDSINVNLIDDYKVKYSRQHHATLARLRMNPLASHVCAFDDPQLRRIIHEANFINTSTVTIRKGEFDSIGGFNPLCQGAEDHDLWVRLALERRFAYWDKVCAIRYKSQVNVSWRSERWLKELIRFHKMYLASAEYNDLHDLSRDHLRSIYRSLIRYYGRHSSPRKAFSTYRESMNFGHDPTAAVYVIASFLGPTPFQMGGMLSRFYNRYRKRINL